MKYYFVSDVHLGSSSDEKENKRVERNFIQWLEKITSEPATIYLLGDIFDFWFEYKYVIPTTHTLVLGKLKELVERGVEIHFFKGNHDMWLRTYLSNDIGLIIHNLSEVVTIEGEKMIVGHGHDMGFKLHLSTRLLWILFNGKLSFFLGSLLHPNIMMKIGSMWSKSSRNGKKSISREFEGESDFIIKAINKNFPKRKDKGINKLIFGHFHAPILYNMADGAELLILGDWKTGATYGVYENGELREERV